VGTLSANICCHFASFFSTLYTKVDQNSQQYTYMVKLSSKGRYGTRVLLDLALHKGEGAVPLKEIAQRQQISLPYLEHLITPLVSAGIVGSRRGARGGVWLTKIPQQIKLSEVVGLLEGPLAPVDCVTDPGACPRSAGCVTRDVWSELKKAMDGVLQSLTLQDLVERQKAKGQLSGAAYQI
jgi:Rrf2 family cysteine metabolism transcriptional repressor